MDNAWGKYLLKRLIARGGMAEVYEATMGGPSGFAKQVCLKRVRADLSDDPEFVQLFEGEARIAATLHHRNIVSVVDFDIHQGQQFLAMEYVDGLDLRHIIRDASLLGLRIPAEFSIYVMENLLAALDHAHNQHHGQEPRPIVHRDVSPHNVLVSKNGDVKLADFGIAKAEGLSNVTRTGVVKGKLSYLSPEELEGRGVKPRTDLFGAGLVLYEMLAGKRLFQAENDRALIAQVKDCSIPTVPQVSEKLNQVLKQFLAKAPNDRFTNAKAALDALESTGMKACSPVEAGRLVSSLMEIRKKTQIIKPTQPLPFPKAPSRNKKTVLQTKSASSSPPKTSQTKMPAIIWGALIVLCTAGVLFGVFGTDSLNSQNVGTALAIPSPQAEFEPSPGMASASPVVQLKEPVSPVEPAVHMGTLEVNVRPWANVQVDGVAKGTTPVKKLHLKAGFHHLTLVNKALDYKRDLTVQIRSGKRTVINKKIPERQE
ncbi:MAG: protein kinase [Proteobacteria bacterium]|nr:protein kinase [Pseudomonadota bacterium]